MDVDRISKELREFARERDWEQFHSPKNLSMALAGEVGELLEHFQWLTELQSTELSAEARAAVAEELADIQIYLIRVADTLAIDLADAVDRKITLNHQKYPVEKTRGSSRKYTEYE